jgi:hypothetical protein
MSAQLMIGQAHDHDVYKRGAKQMRMFGLTFYIVFGGSACERELSKLKFQTQVYTPWVYRVTKTSRLRIEVMPHQHYASKSNHVSRAA